MPDSTLHRTGHSRCPHPAGERVRSRYSPGPGSPGPRGVVDGVPRDQGDQVAGRRARDRGERAELHEERAVAVATEALAVRRRLVHPGFAGERPPPARGEPVSVAP